MFTGIVREIGVLQKKEKRGENLTLTVQSRNLIDGLKESMSVSVNGVCLTCEYLFKDAFKATIIPETLAKTNLGFLHVGSRLNLEPALKLGETFDGHLVTGHVDGIGKVLEKTPIQGGTGLKIHFPPELEKFIAKKGSITLNGVSLTIADVQSETFTVALIPYTCENTNLGDIRPHDLVNIEIDLIARYLDSLNQTHENRHSESPIQ